MARRRRRPAFMLGGVFALLIVGIFLAACGLVSGIDDYGLDDRLENSDGSTSSVDGTTFVDGVSPNDGATGASDTRPCTNLCLRQKVCAAPNTTTSLSGVVRDPAGTRPLYNVLVYVPNADVLAITPGLTSPPTCDRCGSVSGEPLVSTLTKVDGSFKLDNVPVGANVPLVVQIGKWRRQFTIPNVAECVDTPVDPAKTQLPRNQSEGDMPQIALSTGGADVMECLLRKLGIDDAEFTTSNGSGRVHLFAGSGQGNVVTKAFADGGTAFAPALSLWGTPASLMKYDVVMLACEAQTFPATKPPVTLEAVKAFANAGGRIMANHFQRYWFDTSISALDPAGPQPSPFEPFATWVERDIPTAPLLGTVNKSFPKGKAFDDWLALPSVNALDGGKLEITQPRHNIDAIHPTVASSWLTSTIDGGAGTTIESVQVITANTPIPSSDDQKCGRILWADLHSRSADTQADFPNGCTSVALTTQELALEFMFFDLSSCIQNDKVAPVPPQ